MKMNKNVMKSTVDQNSETNLRQRSLRRSISAVNRDHPHKIRIVWRTKSSMEFKNLEKILGISTHRKKSGPQTPPVRTVFMEYQNKIDIPTKDVRMEVKINKEKVKVPSVKSLKSFFENISFEKGGKDSQVDMITVRPQVKKISSSFSRFEDSVVRSDGTNDDVKAKPLLAKIGRSNAIEEEVFQNNNTPDRTTNSDSVKPQDESNMQGLDKNISHHGEINTGSDSPSVNITAHSQSPIVKAELSIIMNPHNTESTDVSHPKQRDNTHKMRTSHDENVSTNIAQTINIGEKPDNYVSNIRAKWERIIKEKNTYKDSAKTFQDASLLNRSAAVRSIPARLEYITAVKNSYASDNNNGNSVRNDKNPSQRSSSFSTKNIVELFELKNSNHISTLRKSYSNVATTTNDNPISTCYQTHEAVLFQGPLEPTIFTAESEKLDATESHMIEEIPNTNVNPPTIFTESLKTTDEAQSVTLDLREQICEIKRKISMGSESDSTSENNGIHFCSADEGIVDDVDHHEETNYPSVLQNDNTFNNANENTSTDYAIVEENLLEPLSKREPIQLEMRDKQKLVLESGVKDNENTLDKKSPDDVSQSEEKDISFVIEQTVALVDCQDNNKPTKTIKSSTTTNELDTSAKAAVSLLKEDKNLDVVQRKGSKLRALHPDELALFRNPSLNHIARGRSQSDVSFNRQ